MVFLGTNKGYANITSNFLELFVEYAKRSQGGNRSAAKKHFNDQMKQHFSPQLRRDFFSPDLTLASLGKNYSGVQDQINRHILGNDLFIQAPFYAKEMNENIAVFGMVRHWQFDNVPSPEGTFNDKVILSLLMFSDDADSTKILQDFQKHFMENGYENYKFGNKQNLVVAGRSLVVDGQLDPSAIRVDIELSALKDRADMLTVIKKIHADLMLFTQ